MPAAFSCGTCSSVVSAQISPIVFPAKASLTSSPAKAGTHFAFSLFDAAAKTVSRPCVFSSAIPGGRVTFFACPKKVTKEMHPLGRGHAGIHARVTTRAGSGVCRQQRPCADGKLAGILPAIAARLFLHLLAATWRDPGRAERGSPCRKKQEEAELPVSSSPRKRGPSAFRARRKLSSSYHGFLF